MNRRNMLKGAVGAGLIPLVAVAGDPGHRELAELLGRMDHEDAFAIYLCSMCLNDGHKWHARTRAWLEQGVPIQEIVKRNVGQAVV